MDLEDPHSQTAGTYFLLMSNATWWRCENYVGVTEQYYARVMIRLNDDGTGTVIKNVYKDEPRLSQTWTIDEMIMVSLKSQDIRWSM